MNKRRYSWYEAYIQDKTKSILFVFLKEILLYKRYKSTKIVNEPTDHDSSIIQIIFFWAIIHTLTYKVWVCHAPNIYIDFTNLYLKRAWTYIRDVQFITSWIPRTIREWKCVYLFFVIRSLWDVQLNSSEKIFVYEIPEQLKSRINLENNKYCPCL